MPAVPAGVRLVRQHDDGFRAAAARNLGVQASTGDLLVLLDADTAPEPAFVERMVALPEALPEALVVGRRRHADLAGTSPEQPVEEVAPPLGLPEPAWLRDAYADSRDLLDADASSHRFVISAVLACSRWWYDEVGGFDETFRAYGGEDWDFAHRSWTAGGLLAHRPDAVAWHDGPDAGSRERDPAALLAETVAVADRTSGPMTTWRGLARGPGDLVVTCAPALADAEVLVTVDSLLAALPRAVVRLSERHRDLVGGDQRVVAADADLPASARLHLDVRGGLVGDAGAWAGARRRPRRVHGIPRDRRRPRRAAGPAPPAPRRAVGSTRPGAGGAVARHLAPPLDRGRHPRVVARRLGRRMIEPRARMAS